VTELRELIDSLRVPTETPTIHATNDSALSPPG